MATENRRRAHDTGTREDLAPLARGDSAQFDLSSGVQDRDDAELGSERTVARPSRPSIRPSAFGMPRSRMSDPVVEESVVVERSSYPPRRSSVPPALSEPPRTSQTVRKNVARAALTSPPPAVKTDIEELLPISQGVKSLPRPPKLPTFEAPQLPPPTTRRFPWMSLSIFAVVLGASLAPLLRYRGERTTHNNVGMVRKELHEVDWASLTPLDNDLEPTLWGLTREQRLDAGERALSTGDAHAAENAFTDALSFRGDDPSAAYGLARARLAEGDLVGARAWAESALDRRPQNERFRMFLERLPVAREPR